MVLPPTGPISRLYSVSAGINLRRHHRHTSKKVMGAILRGEVSLHSGQNDP
jgi:hypothetical protein